MTRYAVQYLNIASFAIEVDAETPAEARALADEKYPEVAPGGLCHQCAGAYSLSDDEQDESDGGVWEI